MTETYDKLESLVATLDDDERAELGTVTPATGLDDLSVGLRTRLEAAAGELTSDDKAEILATVGSVAGGDDVAGFGWGGGTVNDNRTPGFGDPNNVRDHRAGSSGFVYEVHQVYDIFAKIF